MSKVTVAETLLRAGSGRIRSNDPRSESGRERQFVDRWVHSALSVDLSSALMCLVAAYFGIPALGSTDSIATANPTVTTFTDLLVQDLQSMKCRPGGN